MQNLTSEAENTISNLAKRYGVSQDAVMNLFYALQQGQGTMAQFNHRELGGSGQWMPGMVMIGDMFNNALKAKVDGLCIELNQLLSRNPFVPAPPRPPASQQQWQSNQSSGQSSGGVSLSFSSQEQSLNWWPDELGMPSTSGSQNQYRYAYFPHCRRLAIHDGQKVTVYDTQDHQIGGVSQQQSGSASVTFTSQYGLVDVAYLPIVSGGSQNQSLSGYSQNSPQNNPQSYQSSSQNNQNYSATPVANTAQEADVYAALERLAKLKEQGILSDAEFTSKKAELLKRI